MSVLFNVVSLLLVRKAKQSAGGVSVCAHTLIKAEPTKAQLSGNRRRSRSREGIAERVSAFFANVLSSIRMKQLIEGEHEHSIFMCCCINLA